MRLQTEELSFGKAHVFYAEASENLCTAALLVGVLFRHELEILL